MDPVIAAAIAAIDSVARLVESLAKLEAVKREHEGPAHKAAREEMEIEGYKLGTAFIRVIPRPPAPAPEK